VDTTGHPLFAKLNGYVQRVGFRCSSSGTHYDHWYTNSEPHDHHYIIPEHRRINKKGYHVGDRCIYCSKVKYFEWFRGPRGHIHIYSVAHKEYISGKRVLLGWKCEVPGCNDYRPNTGKLPSYSKDNNKKE
jgi:hypothetical protein